jgi:hypothetical protein
VFPPAAIDSGCDACDVAVRARADAALAWWIGSVLDWWLATQASCGPARAAGVTLDSGSLGSVPLDLAPAADAGPR